MIDHFFQNVLSPLFSAAPFDYLSLGVFNLRQGIYTIREFQKNPQSGPMPLLYDLASLTKPLTLASTFLRLNSAFTHDLQLLLNHQAGLPPFALLDRTHWRNLVLSFPLNSQGTSTLYSDLSALRLQLELERKLDRSLANIFTETFQQLNGQRDWHVLHHQQIPTNKFTIPPTGFRNSTVICGEVHDPNAYNLGGFLAHAGLFADIKSLILALIHLQRFHGLLQFMEPLFSGPGSRFRGGWDTPSDPKNTLAGSGFPPATFGHLGFTGTSLWIDAVTGLGHIVLCNATQKFWYERQELNAIRKNFGEFVWKNGANILSSKVAIEDHSPRTNDDRS